MTLCEPSNFAVKFAMIVVNFFLSVFNQSRYSLRYIFQNKDGVRIVFPLPTFLKDRYCNLLFCCTDVVANRRKRQSNSLAGQETASLRPQ
jgi:hypothetical protein